VDILVDEFMMETSVYPVDEAVSEENECHNLKGNSNPTCNQHGITVNISE